MEGFRRTYCRFCAEPKLDDCIMHINTDPTFFQQISDILSFVHANYIDLSPENLLPKTICLSCYGLLLKSHEFLLKVRSAQLSLTQGVPVFEHVKLEPPVASSSCLKFKEEAREGAAASAKAMTMKQPETVPADPSWTGYIFHCACCPSSFPSMNELRDHTKRDHKMCNALQCGDCDEKFGNFETYAAHIRGHRSGLRNYCHYCNKKLSNPELAKSHIDKHISSQRACPRCGEIFKTTQSLTKHVIQYKNLMMRNATVIRKRKKKTVEKIIVCEPNDKDDTSWTGYSWECLTCDSEFENMAALRLHSMETHSKCFALQCGDCDESMDCFKTFVDHIRKHRPYLKQFCEYCNHKFEPGQESAHIDTHFEGLQKSCDGCGLILPDFGELQNHIAKYDSPMPKTVPFKKKERPVTTEDLTCRICNHVSKCVRRFQNHLKLHTERKRDHTCDKCGKAFYTKSSLTAHLIIHSNTNSWVCEVCKRSFLTIIRLKKHVKTHYADKPFECAVCKRTFRLKEQLKNHSIMHTDEMPFRCQFCDKCFRHKNVLKTHENQHTGARPYSCTECTMDFANWSNCNKHMKRKHGMTIAKSKLTPIGKLPINPKTGLPNKVDDLSKAKEWTQQILATTRRRTKRPKADDDDDN
ncbi:hypothetical protein JYU34_001311 [Plutella xylostella]|uniref:Uncharacterized protein n=1 Tax=Plutella xylostella TaxID=51655 RepID=A0ABQ7R6P9_PLUXY|nr:hypothetical protein JYU34_001311 [Plutella xylostella]